jgi:cellulose synthase operon protein C
MTRIPLLRDLSCHAVDRSAGCIRPRLATWLMLAFALATAVPGTALADLDDDYNLALQFYKQERWDLATEKLQSFVKDAPAEHGKLPLAKLYLGQALVHQRNFAAARPVFRDFVQSHPQQGDLPLAMYRVAECSYFLDDFAAARDELNAFLAKVPADNPLSEWALQYLGETQLQLKDYAAARDAFAKGVQSFPKGRLIDELKFGLARAYDQLDEPEAARKLYEEIAGGNSARAADAQFNLAALLFERKDYEPAAKLFEATATKFAEHKIVPLATLNAGYSRYHLKQYAPAMELFAKVRSDARYGADAEYWTGLSQKSLEQWEQAAATLLAQFAKDEQQPLAESLLFHAADARLGAKNYAEALRLFRDVHRRWPTGEMADDALHLATEAALLAGDSTAAAEIDAQFRKEFPQSGLRLPQDLLSGRLLLADGDRLSAEDGAQNSEQAMQQYHKSAEAFTRVLEQSTIEETKSLARLQLARAWDRLGNHEQVLTTLKPLVDTVGQPSATDEARTALAMQSTALLSLKRYEEALEAATTYLRRPTNGPERAEALANICLANAHLQKWPQIDQPLRRLRETGNERLTNRVTYEVAEAAYDASQWETAEAFYQQLVDKGAGSEFYRPALSGLAYALYEQGQVLNQQVVQAEQQGKSDVGLLNRAIGRFDAAIRWFTQLAQLSSEQNDRAIESDALYMQGLSLRLARRLPDAATTLMQAAEKFALPGDAQQPDETAVAAAYNAFRSAKEAARVYQQLQQTDASDAAYQLAFDQLQRQPAERRDALGGLVYEWALMHYNADNTARADELFKRFLETDPQSEWADDARLVLAESLYFGNKHEDAQKAFQTLSEDKAADDFVRERSLLFLMTIAAQLEDWKPLQTSARNLAEQFPAGKHEQEARYRQAEAAVHLEDFETAKSILSDLATRHDDQALAAQEWYPGVWLLLAEAHLRLKEYDELSRVAADFVQRHPDSPLAYQIDVVMGRALKQQARFDEARAEFAKVIDSPQGKGTETAAKAQLFIAETHLLQKDYQQAFEEYYRVLLYGFPELQSAALYQAGQCEETLKQWQGAAKSYRQLLEDFPDSEYAEKAEQRLQDLEKRFPETVGN